MLRTAGILLLAQCICTSLCLCSQPVAPCDVELLASLTAMSPSLTSKQAFPSLLDQQLDKKHSKKMRRPSFYESRTDNCNKSCPFYWSRASLVDSCCNAEKLELIKSEEPCCRQAAGNPGGKLVAAGAGRWGYRGCCAAGRDGREDVGGGREEKPLPEISASSNKTQSRDPRAEVCFSESAAHGGVAVAQRGCWRGCLAEYKELLVGLLVTCPEVLQARLCFLVLITW